MVGLEASLQTVDAMMGADTEALPPDAPTILIVEDHADVREYLKSHLAGRYRIEEAADGVEGLETTRETQPALVVSDVMMPRMDGYELCRRIKTDEALNHIPVVLLTAKAGQRVGRPRPACLEPCRGKPPVGKHAGRGLFLPDIAPFVPVAERAGVRQMV
ncbi:MAG: response regulator [Bacteroidetes bacterium]|nr:response regulator [Bacteroidota bacterium]